jgi:hypothetical protein
MMLYLDARAVQMHEIQKRIVLRMLLFVLLAVTSTVSCGYHVRRSIGRLPDGMNSIGIPTFKNLTNEFKIEQIVTKSVLKEFSARTTGRVSSDNTGVDLVLLGEIRSLDLLPVIYRTQTADEKTFGSVFQVTMRVSVKLVRQQDTAIIWQNEDYIFRERYLLNSNVRDFFSEENPAWERMANSFSTGLTSAILNR